MCMRRLERRWTPCGCAWDPRRRHTCSCEREASRCAGRCSHARAAAAAWTHVAAGLHAMSALFFASLTKPSGWAVEQVHLCMPPCGQPGELFLFQFLSLFFILFLFLSFKFNIECTNKLSECTSNKFVNQNICSSMIHQYQFMEGFISNYI